MAEPLRVKVPKGIGRVKIDAYVHILQANVMQIVPLLDPGPGDEIAAPMKLKFRVSFRKDAPKVEGMGTQDGGAAARVYIAPFYDGQLIKVTADVRRATEQPRIGSGDGRDYFGQLQENMPLEFDVEIIPE